MKNIVEWILSAVIFLLPLQTVWIIQEQTIGLEGAVGVWQYGTLKMYAVEFLIVALAVVAVLQRCISWGFPRNFSRSAPAFIFLLFSGLSIVWSEDRLVALFAWARLLEGALLFFLVRTFPIRWAFVFGAWIAAALIQSMLGIWQFAVQEVVAQKFFGIAAHYPLTLGDAVVEAGDRRWLRAYGGFPHPNMLGAYLAVSAVLCASALLRLKDKWRWLILILSSQVILIALMLSFSRSAWLALAIAVIGCLTTILFRYGRHGILMSPFTTAMRSNTQRDIGIPYVHPAVVMALVSAVTIGIFVSFFSEEITTRFGFSQSRLEAQSISERIGGIQRAIPLLKEHFLFGTGIGNFTNTLFSYERAHGDPQPWYTYQPLHNTFLMIFAELGLFGLFFFFLLLFFLFWRAPVTGLPLLAALFVLSFFDHFLWTHPFGLFFAAITLGISVKMWYNK